MRLNRYQASCVKYGLIKSLNDHFEHPDSLPNEFDGVWISDHQKFAYLRRLADAGHIQVKRHCRGWYVWNTYRRLPRVDEFGMDDGDYDRP